MAEPPTSETSLENQSEPHEMKLPPKFVSKSRHTGTRSPSSYRGQMSDSFFPQQQQLSNCSFDEIKHVSFSGQFLPHAASGADPTVCAKAIVGRTRSLTEVEAKSRPTFKAGENPHEAMARGLEGMFWVREKKKSKMLVSFVQTKILQKNEAQKEGTPWKKRYVRAVNSGTSHDSRLEIFRIVVQPGPKSTEDFSIDKLVFACPMTDLHDCEKRFVSSADRLDFWGVDSAGQTTKEFRYGHLMLELTFSNPTLAPLQLCCSSVEMRDEWLAFFSNFILQCEVEELKADPKNEIDVKPELLGEPPVDGVQLFINNFIKGGEKIAAEEQKKKNKLKEEVVDLAHPPKKGVVAVLASDPTSSTGKGKKDFFKKRIISCPEVGTLRIAGPFGRKKVDIDLGSSTIEVDDPWAHSVFVRLSPTALAMLSPQTESLLWIFGGRFELQWYKREGGNESRQALIDWLMLAKGSEQDRLQTYLYEVREAQAERHDTSLTAKDETETLPEDAHLEGIGEGAESEEVDDEEEEVVAQSSGTDGTMAPPQKKKKEPKLRAKSLLAQQAEGLGSFSSRFASFKKQTQYTGQDILGCWCQVEFNQIGAPPSFLEATFHERMVCFDSKKARICVLSQLSRRRRGGGYLLTEESLIAQLYLRDIRHVTTCSALFGFTGFTLHCVIDDQWMEMILVPLKMTDKAQWIHLFEGYEIAHPNGLIMNKYCTREEVNERLLRDAGTRRPCAVCGKLEDEEAVCQAMGLLHAGYIERLEPITLHSSSDDDDDDDDDEDLFNVNSGEELVVKTSILSMLPLKKVMPPESISACIANTQAVLKYAKEARQRILKLTLI